MHASASRLDQAHVCMHNACRHDTCTEENPIVAIAVSEQHAAAAVNSACCLRGADKSQAAFTLLGQSEMHKPVCTSDNDVWPAELKKAHIQIVRL